MRYKNLQVVQNEADELTTKCIQLITNRIEKRRDLFADLLPKFKEHIDKGTQVSIHINAYDS